MAFTRRAALTIGAYAMAPIVIGQPAFGRSVADPKEGIQSYGVSPFGDLNLPSNFQHLPYVNPEAPKGGDIVLQLKHPIGNQNVNTFNNLNIYVLNGDGAAGVQSTFDTMMAPSLDEKNALYGLVAHSVETSPDGLMCRFSLRPEARFHDGSKLTAADVAFSLLTLKAVGHPVYRDVLQDMIAAEAVSHDVVRVRFAPNRGRDIHVVVASMPIFSQRSWEGRDFDAATLSPVLGSGPYKIGSFEQGRFIQYERVANYWAANLPVNIGMNNFDTVRYVYFRDRQVAMEAFKSGEINYHEELNPRTWATAYDFPAAIDGRVKKLNISIEGPVPILGWFLNTRREQFKDPRVREALDLAFDFEWTNKNIMFSAFERATSFFQNSDMMATGKPGAEELAVMDKFRDQLKDSIFGDAIVPPISDGSGSDRALLRKASNLLHQAGYILENGALKMPDGRPMVIEFLSSSNALQAETGPFIANLRKLGIDAQSRIVDPAQFVRRRNEFDFDAIPMVYAGSLTPGDELKSIFGSQARTTPGSRNVSGIADPVVDAVLERISVAPTRRELTILCRVLDRILRAGRYWVPLWYRQNVSIAYWNLFSRPDRAPRFGTGAPETWWWNKSRDR
jgi:microcin C transport system substrate-binding protein